MAMLCTLCVLTLWQLEVVCGKCPSGPLYMVRCITLIDAVVSGYLVMALDGNIVLADVRLL